MTDLMPGPGYTWDHDDIMGVYTLTRRIWVGRDMTVLEMHRRIQDFLDTVNGILWDQITIRQTDEIIEWYGDPYEIVGPGRLHSGSIIDRRNSDVVLYPPAMHVYRPLHPVPDSVGLGTGPCQYPGCEPGTEWFSHGALDIGTWPVDGRCICTRDHGRDECGPQTRGGRGYCWSCTFLRKCHEQEA